MEERRNGDKRLNEIHSMVKDVHITIHGDKDHEGLTTKVALNTQSLKRLWRVVWIPLAAAIGAVTTAMFK